MPMQGSDCAAKVAPPDPASAELPEAREHRCKGTRLQVGCQVHDGPKGCHAAAGCQVLGRPFSQCRSLLAASRHADCAQLQLLQRRQAGQTRHDAGEAGRLRSGQRQAAQPLQAAKSGSDLLSLQRRAAAEAAQIEHLQRRAGAKAADAVNPAPIRRREVLQPEVPQAGAGRQPCHVDAAGVYCSRDGQLELEQLCREAAQQGALFPPDLQSGLLQVRQPPQEDVGSGCRRGHVELPDGGAERLAQQALRVRPPQQGHVGPRRASIAERQGAGKVIMVGLDELHHDAGGARQDAAALHRLRAQRPCARRMRPHSVARCRCAVPARHAVPAARINRSCTQQTSSRVSSSQEQAGAGPPRWRPRPNRSTSHARWGDRDTMRSESYVARGAPRPRLIKVRRGAVKYGATAAGPLTLYAVLTASCTGGARVHSAPAQLLASITGRVLEVGYLQLPAIAVSLPACIAVVVDCPPSPHPACFAAGASPTRRRRRRRWDRRRAAWWVPLWVARSVGVAAGATMPACCRLISLICHHGRPQMISEQTPAGARGSLAQHDTMGAAARLARVAAQLRQG
jgi:hypothetical protein